MHSTECISVGCTSFVCEEEGWYDADMLLVPLVIVWEWVKFIVDVPLWFKGTFSLLIVWNFCSTVLCDSWYELVE